MCQEGEGGLKKLVCDKTLWWLRGTTASKVWCRVVPGT